MSKQFPHTTQLVHDLSISNGTSHLEKPEHKWEWPDNAGEIEEEASLLTSEESRLLINASEEDQERFRECIPLLWDFVYQVFDGELADCFYDFTILNSSPRGQL